MIPVQPGNLGTIERRCEDGDDVSLTGNVVDIRLVIRIRKPKRSNKPIFVENNRFVDSIVLEPTLVTGRMIEFLRNEIVTIVASFGLDKFATSFAGRYIGSFCHRMFVLSSVRTVFGK